MYQRFETLATVMGSFHLQTADINEMLDALTEKNFPIGMGIPFDEDDIEEIPPEQRNAYSGDVDR